MERVDAMEDSQPEPFPRVSERREAQMEVVRIAYKVITGDTYPLDTEMVKEYLTHNENSCWLTSLEMYRLYVKVQFNPDKRYKSNNWRTLFRSVFKKQ